MGSHKMESAEPTETWRSLEERSGDDAFEERLAREFERPLFEWNESSGVDRRRFLQLSGASLALAGLTGCTTQPPEKIVPYVEQPEEVVPGKPLFYATAMTLEGYARPLLGESHLGRPTKVEGNPEHPVSRGASDLFAQASVLTLYDPDRAQSVRHYGKQRPWRELETEMNHVARALEAEEGRGLRILSGAVSSPTLSAQIDRVLERFPQARWHRWEAAGRHGAEQGALDAFGEPVETIYRLAEADVILSLDSDFLTSAPGDLTYARDFADRRRVDAESPNLSRLYAVESTPTNTGATADHRLALPPSQVAAFALALAAELGVSGAGGETNLSGPAAARWVKAVAEDLQSARGRSLVVVGDQAPAELHVLAHAMNSALGNVGTTVTYVDPVLRTAQKADGSPAGPVDSLAELVDDMRAGDVSTLVILGANPVFDGPADLRIAEAMDQVERRIYLGLYENETSERCHWMVPESHYLESWGDGRSFDGTVTLTQPLINPLYETRTATQLLAFLAGDPAPSDYRLLRSHWTSEGLSGADFRTAVHAGFVEDTAAQPRSGGSVSGLDRAVQGLRELVQGGEGGDDTLELVLRPDPTVRDGSWVNNAWLQECPKPWTKLTWDNALLVSPATAQARGWSNEDVVRISGGGEETSVEAPVWVLPGHAEGCATLHVGYGRRRVGVVGAETGVDAYPLQQSGNPWLRAAVTVEATGGTHALASTQDHFSMDGRGQVRTATLEHYREDPEFAQHWGHSHAPAQDETLYEPYDYSEGYSWGLAVDLNACTGCNACVVACQSENNIPVVGKSQVLNGREMHWIRIDRYFEGGVDEPTVHHQPVMCQHCELAPCEVVCPVAATVHSSEGLNDMVYNRCVGTRYCSNNCPYKVRRFNFLEYNDHDSPVLKLLRNPDVTLRERGVMEKCTFCVQRINGARQEAKVQERTIEDGEIQTACQQACPSGAIVFGDLNDETSRVTEWKSRPTNYGLLAELNTRPRTSYLAKVKNPNPALERA